MLGNQFFLMGELDESGETAAKEETGINLEELNKIAAEINNTPPCSRGNIAIAEFGWLYFPRQQLQPLKVQTNVLAQLMMREGAFVMEAFSGTDAIAVVHNHPGGEISPTIEDINVLLRAAADNEKLDYALIAATDSGEVTGFYELQYLGERLKARDLIQKNNDLYKDRLMKKWKWLDQHPEIMAKMSVGDSVLSPDDHRQLGQNAMAGSLVVGRARPLNGFRFENAHFVPDTL